MRPGRRCDQRARSRRRSGAQHGRRSRAHDRPSHEGSRLTVTIRPEQPDDFDAIGAVVEAAFGSPVESKLVRDIRADACYRPELALVAEREGMIVGHTMVSKAELHNGDTVHRIAMLSPLAVDPAVQRDGIGSALVQAVTAKANELGEPMVILEGSPSYYARFGFVDSRTLGIEVHLPDWAPREAGQVLTLTAYDPALRGTVVYPPPFDALE